MKSEEKKKPLNDLKSTMTVVILGGTTQIIVLEFEIVKGSQRYYITR